MQKSLHHHADDLLQLLQRQHIVGALSLQGQQGLRHEVLSQLIERQQQVELEQKLKKLHQADLAYVLQMLSEEKRRWLWQQLTPVQQGGALVELNSALRAALLQQLSHPQLLDILSNLNTDDLSVLADDIQDDVFQELLSQLESKEQQWLQASLSYPEHSVGALMSHEALIFSEQLSLNQVTSQLRTRASWPHQADKLFVVDRFRHLSGELSLSALLRHDGELTLAEVMQKDVVRFLPEENAHTAALAFERYDLVSAAVTDQSGIIIGSLSVESIMDYQRQRAQDKALAREGLSAKADLLAPVKRSLLQRRNWLAINVLTAFIASRFIGLFEDSIAQLVALASLMPIVASLGGNTGNQTIALVIRALGLNQLSRNNLLQIYRNEITLAAINGLFWGAMLGLLAILLYQQFVLGLVMMSATLLNMLLASVVGISIPLLLHWRGRDPALGSSVLLTFVTDSMGFIIFLSLASWWLL